MCLACEMMELMEMEAAEAAAASRRKGRNARPRKADDFICDVAIKAKKPRKRVLSKPRQRPIRAKVSAGRD